MADHCLRSRNYVNVIVAGKQPALTYLTMDEAIAHCTRGLGIWQWASNTDGEPDVVLACAGDVPTLETLAAADLLRTHLPDLKVRVVNVVDLMRLQPDTEHPHGLPDAEFDALFTADKPVIFAYHGYPWLIHRLTYRRNNHHNIHVRGYKEEGTTTTPFDMVMLNDLDRFHLVMDVIDRVPSLGSPRRDPAPADGRRPPRRPRLHPRARRGRSGDHRLDLAGAGLTRCGCSSSTPAPRASSCGCSTADDTIERSADLPAGPDGFDTSRLAEILRRLAKDPTWSATASCTAARLFTGPVRIDAAVRRAAAGPDRPGPAAPAQVPGRARRRQRTRCPASPAVACFDTAFHATIPAAAATYAVPREWRQRYGIRRYGFHGLSHAYCSRRAAQLLGRPLAGLRIVTCHLGAGASLAAVLRRAQRRHHHGLHSAGGPGHGHPVRHRRPRAGALARRA